MDKIVFTLNNTGIHHDHSAMAFVTVEYLLQHTESGAHRFISNLSSYTVEDFQRLSLRVKDESQTQVPMNEKHLIIFYSVVYYACAAYVNPTEKKILRKMFQQQPDDLPMITEKLLAFGAVVSQKLRKDFTHLRTFSKVAERIAID